MEKKIVLVHKQLSAGHRAAIDALAHAHGYETHYYDENAEAYEEIKDAEIAFGMGADLIKQGKELKWFCSSTAGVDIYLQPGVIEDPDMLLSNSSGAYGVTLAEHTLMLTLELLRKQMTFNQIVAKKGWDKSPQFRSIKDARVTILGTGDLGQEIAKRVKGFEPERVIGVNLRGANPMPAVFDEIRKQEEVDAVLPETDILLMCLPGTPATFHFMNEKRFALLPSHAVLVNVGRGNNVDPAALKEALDSGRLAAAALDVFEKEPLPEDDPLWETQNLLITPHVAGNMTLGYTVEKCASLFIEDLENYLEGRPLNRLVDRTRGY